MSNLLSLYSLVGPHSLTGWDHTTIAPAHEWAHRDAAVLNLELDGVTYSFVENPNDGYRSSLNYVTVSNRRPATRFPAVSVMAVKETSDNNQLLRLYAVQTGEMVAEVGTVRVDEYYPQFRAWVSPPAVNEALHPAPRATDVVRLFQEVQLIGQTLVMVTWRNGNASFSDLRDFNQD